MLEGGHKSTKNELSMGVTIGGDAEKSGKKNHLLVRMCVRLGRGVYIVIRVAKLSRFVGIMYAATSVLYYLSPI